VTSKHCNAQSVSLIVAAHTGLQLNTVGPVQVEQASLHFSQASVVAFQYLFDSQLQNPTRTVGTDTPIDYCGVEYPHCVHSVLSGPEHAAQDLWHGLHSCTLATADVGTNLTDLLKYRAPVAVEVHGSMSSSEP
jgi:hypothetical protein